MKRAYIDILIRYLYLYITDIYRIKRHQWDWVDKKNLQKSYYLNYLEIIKKKNIMTVKIL